MTATINGKTVKIPEYVKDLMSRSRYAYDFYRNHENYAPGYTIKIRKHSAYAQVDTLRKEVERLVKWANRVTGVEGLEIAYILDVPEKTHYCNQVAVVTIFDPVMQKIEKYIPEN